MTMILTSHQVKDILPQRYPLILVDGITELDERTRVVGVKKISARDYCLNGEIHGQLIMPGTILLEIMAQVGSIMFLAIDDLKGKLAYLTAIRKARFHKPVRPGDTLMIEVRLTRHRGSMGTIKGIITVDDEIVCSANLSFYLTDAK